MKFRNSAVVASLILLEFAATNPASAQPVVPGRGPASAFGNLFGPGSSAVPNANMTAFGLNRAGVAGPFGGNAAGGAGMGGQGAYGPWTPYFLSRQPVVFNYRGHWFANYYGHWYPNGRTSGLGVLSNGGIGGGGLRGGGTGFPGAGGVTGFGSYGGMGMSGGAGGMNMNMPGAGGGPNALPIIR